MVSMFPLSDLRRNQLMTTQIVQYLKEVDCVPTKEGIATIVESSAIPEESREMFILHVAHFSLFSSSVVSLSKYNRKLDFGEGWYWEFVIEDGVWVWRFTLNHRDAEDNSVKEMMFRFIIAPRQSDVEIPVKGNHVWPEIIAQNHGILELESARAILDFFKEDHPREETQPIVLPIGEWETMSPIGRIKSYKTIFYTAAIILSRDYEWRLVPDKS